MEVKLIFLLKDARKKSIFEKFKCQGEDRSKLERKVKLTIYWIDFIPSTVFSTKIDSLLKIVLDETFT